ncbi:hypothetical protein F5879DRAFT_946453 [Lentinula edodes]|nr:hypothetical protein F5879DRAFT_946453 [Lentinula edodes]
MGNSRLHVKLNFAYCLILVGILSPQDPMARTMAISTSSSSNRNTKLTKDRPTNALVLSHPQLDLWMFIIGISLPSVQTSSSLSNTTPKLVSSETTKLGLSRGLYRLYF